MVSGRIRFKKIDSLGREDGKEEGLLAGLPQWKHLLSSNKGNYCFERCDCLSLATCVICRPQELVGG